MLDNNVNESLIGWLRHARKTVAGIASVVTLTFLFLVLSPTMVAARQMWDEGLPKSAQTQAPGVEAQFARTVIQLKRQLERIAERLERDQGPPDWVVFKQLRGELERLDRAVRRNFEHLEDHIERQGLPSVILTRHLDAVERYEGEFSQLTDELVTVTESEDEETLRAALNSAIRHLSTVTLQRPRQPIDFESLPFRSAKRVLSGKNGVREGQWLLGKKNEAPKSQTNDAKGEPRVEDLAETTDVKITPSIEVLAEELNHNPLRLYQWVRNNIAFIPTFGSVQGSALTLLKKEGNATDTASLLIALLRNSDIPARYSFGTVEVPIERAMSWLGGVESPNMVVELLSEGGIPAAPVTQDNQIIAVQFKHVWVEAWIDYEPSLGAVHRTGDTWIPMDPSFKQHDIGATITLPDNIKTEIQDFVNNAIEHSQTSEHGGVTSLFPRYTRLNFDQWNKNAEAALTAKYPDMSFEDLAGKKDIIEHKHSAFASSLPYKLIGVNARYSRIPDGSRHYAEISLYQTERDRQLDAPVLNKRIALPELKSQRIGITYVPATEDDAAVIQSAKDSGQESLPLSLIRVKPKLTLDEEILAVGPSVSMGKPQFWAAKLVDPQGLNTSTETFAAVAGDEVVVGVNSNGVTSEMVTKRFSNVDPNSAAENLHQLSLRFWLEHDLVDQLTAQHQEARVQRLPSVGFFSSKLTVNYLFGIPRTGYYETRVVDVKRALVAVAASNPEQEPRLVRQLGIQGSYLEGSVLDQVFSRFQGVGQSTAQVFLDAAAEDIPIYTVTSSNADQVVPLLKLDSQSRTEIENAVSVGLTVIAPERFPRDQIGYAILDPDTGAGAYLLDFGFNGGSQEECPEPQLEPLTKSIGAKLLTLVALGIAAIILATGGAAAPVTGGASAPAALVLAMSIVGISSLTFSADTYADNPDACCVPQPRCPHAGGDLIHDTCADEVPPNRFPGCDVEVDFRRFDALSNDSETLWEFKVWPSWDELPEFIQERRASGFAEEFRKDRLRAARCDYDYVFAVNDEDIRQRMIDADVPEDKVVNIGAQCL